MLTQSVVARAAIPLTLDDVFASPSLFGTPPSAPKWAPDSRSFAFTWNDKGLPDRGLWLSSADGKQLRQIPLPDTSTSLRDFVWRGDGQSLLVLQGGELWQIATSDGSAEHLGILGDGVSTLTMAPDGRQLAFLKGGDLWIFDLEKKTLRPLSDLGIPPLSNLTIGRYNRAEREIGPGIWGGPTYAWSPDSKRIAVHLVDRQSMRKVPFPDYLAAETTPNEIRRGYPGDANESRQVGIIDLSDGRLERLPLEKPDARQVIGFSWSGKGVLLLDIASDTAEDRWLYRVDEQNELILVWHSNRPSRIYTAFASAWHSDNERIVFLSDLDNRYGLYQINAFTPEEFPKRISNANTDVLSAPHVTTSGEIFYTANLPSPAERHVLRIGANGGPPEQLTRLPGYNSAHPSPDGAQLAFIHSEASLPPEIYTLTAPGQVSHRVTHSPSERFEKQDWARSRYVSFPSHIDDYTLHARILEPPNLEPGKKYPVLFGPMYSNTVRNRWSGRYSRIQQLLVQKGYIVVQVDMRGSTGYGRDFREEFLVDFAGDDIEDIVSAVDYLKSQPHMDIERMGIWGSSYGGTLSIYTLLKKPGLFRAGVAAAAAVDPHFFGTDDVAIVRRPDTHPEVFLNTAARYAENLEDHLLIIHGMQDQVVPFKTTAALADLLIKKGKDFDFAFAPGATHSWSREAHYSRYLFGKMLTHFDRYLLPEAAASK
ncbi:prolyl oligopeptidase family serine peptidase [Congregibacter brevis]|uniref:Prolyl oligopeptidase family serine peptidase n=1 Tax=Congregibacter brevis TaxID=3081201 RepID=A0ABZ0ICB3_9GAMM|nr:prolyl oligopeptidase family serine peptidase [Congregibacter sp. IMCC45268]